MRKTHPGKTPPKMTKVPPPPPLRTSSQLSQQPQSEKFDPYKLQQVNLFLNILFIYSHAYNERFHN